MSHRRPLKPYVRPKAWSAPAGRHIASRSRIELLNMAHAVPLEAVQIEMQSNPSRMLVRALAGGHFAVEDNLDYTASNMERF